MIITRRFFVCTQRIGGKGITVDVRTSDKVPAAQASANAESLALRELKAKSVFVTAIPFNENVKPNVSIGPKPTLKKTSSPVFIEISGGVVSSVKNCRQPYAVIDWDSLLGDAVDTPKEWKRLSKTAQQFIESEYPEDFDKIQDRIAAQQ